MARVTSRDVAREAGVSQTTVSFVLNGRDELGISADTRRLVIETADRMGYIPSSAGRALRRGKSDVVLCVLPDFVVSDAMEHFKVNLSRRLAEAGYACVFFHRFSAGALSKLWRRIHPAAVVSFGTMPASDAKMLGQAGIPLLDRVFTGAVELTGMNQEDAGRFQVEHLVERGHRRIGFAAVADPREAPFCGPRERGVREACRRLGLPDPWVAELDGTRRAVHTALGAWTSDPEPVTAVAAFNDFVAFTILAGCRSLSIGVPGDLAVIGVDDLPMAEWSDPPLSSVAMDLSAPADTLADHILAALAGSPGPGAPVAIADRPMLRTVRREST